MVILVDSSPFYSIPANSDSFQSIPMDSGGFLCKFLSIPVDSPGFLSIPQDSCPFPRIPVGICGGLKSIAQERGGAPRWVDACYWGRIEVARIKVVVVG